MSLENKVKQIIISNLQLNKDEKITENSSFTEDLGADSLDVVELVMALEEEFDIEISDNDSEKLNTFGDVIKFLTSKGVA
jgi:acyl carrier protein